MTSSKTSAKTIVRRVIVSGRVQGVGYRQSLAERARIVNVLGWCRNLADGRVEAWIQGSPELVDDLLAWMRKGPENAVVEHVDVEEQAVLEPLLNETIQMFEIRR